MNGSRALAMDVGDSPVLLLLCGVVIGSSKYEPGDKGCTGGG